VLQRPDLNADTRHTSRRSTRRLGGLAGAILWLLAGGMGCQHQQTPAGPAKTFPGTPAAAKSAPAKPPVPVRFQEKTGQRPLSSPRRSTSSPPPAKAITTILGRVETVNTQSWFVVVDFSLSVLPSKDQLLGVYHAGQRVGQVRMSGPFRPPRVAGDLLSGQAQVDDEVREE